MRVGWRSVEKYKSRVAAHILSESVMEGMTDMGKSELLAVL